MKAAEDELDGQGPVELVDHASAVARGDHRQCGHGDPVARVGLAHGVEPRVELIDDPLSPADRRRRWSWAKRRSSSGRCPEDPPMGIDSAFRSRGRPRAQPGLLHLPRPRRLVGDERRSDVSGLVGAPNRRHAQGRSSRAMTAARRRRPLMVEAVVSRPILQDRAREQTVEIGSAKPGR